MMNEAGAPENPKVSVIIPVWNPGSGIDRCIESLRTQTLEEIEMIFVDDCGTDDAMEKVRKAAEEDPRIRIVTNPRNLGPGPSRNEGIRTARGEYLSFADPDDYIGSDFLEILYNGAVTADADIAKGTCVYLRPDGSFVKRPVSLNQIIIKGLAEQKPIYILFTYEHWAAVYRHRLFDNPEVRYGMSRRDQDTVFLLRVCTYAEKIVICEDACYMYCERPGSITYAFHDQGLLALHKAFEEKFFFIIDHFDENEHSLFYLLLNIHRRLKILYAVKKDPHFEKSGTRFIEKLRNLILLCPWADALGRKSPAVQILMDHGVCLAYDVYALPWERRKPAGFAELLFDWIRFLLRHPRYIPACGKKFLKSGIKVLRMLAGR